MKNPTDRILEAFEVHSRAGIEEALADGIDASASVGGKPLVDHLIEMYFRSDAFPACLRLMLDRGAEISDRLLRAVLLDDVAEFDALAPSDTVIRDHRVSLTCAFSPLVGASLLHVAAEYGHVAVARRLIELGANSNATAAVDEDGFNGHTPIFHTVNSHQNRSAPVMRLLLDAGARTDLCLAGITWGKGFDWETICLDVTPISFAQMGLLRQMQRTEADTWRTIRELMNAAGRRLPSTLNVPNRYLAS